MSQVKLGELATAREWRARAGADPEAPTVARIYELYEAHQREQRQHDFDDQIMLAVRALRADGAVRARWQAHFDRVLVDEYQDIEPAQGAAGADPRRPLLRRLRRPARVNEMVDGPEGRPFGRTRLVAGAAVFVHRPHCEGAERELAVQRRLGVQRVLGPQRLNYDRPLVSR